MSIMTRKERERLLRKQYIIDAAERVFSKNGFEATTMKQIADEAEFSRQTLYAYFTSKEELLLILFINFAKKRFQLIKNASDKLKTSYQKIEIIGKVYYEFYQNYPEILRLQQHMDYKGVDFTNIKEEIQNQFKEFYFSTEDYFNEIIESGKKEGSINKNLNINFLTAHLPVMLRVVLGQIIFLKRTDYISGSPDDYSPIKPTSEDKAYYFDFVNNLMRVVKP